MKVREAMTEHVLTITPGRTLRDAARFMTEHTVGAAVIMDPEQPGPGIITERDILYSLGDGQDPDAERVAAHLTSDLVFASPEWSLEEAAAAMVRGSFRHLIVIDGGEITGIISVRDIVRCWTGEGATSDVPQGAPTGG